MEGLQENGGNDGKELCTSYQPHYSSLSTSTSASTSISSSSSSPSSSSASVHKLPPIVSAKQTRSNSSLMGSEQDMNTSKTILTGDSSHQPFMEKIGSLFFSTFFMGDSDSTSSSSSISSSSKTTLNEAVNIGGDIQLQKKQLHGDDIHAASSQTSDKAEDNEYKSPLFDDKRDAFSSQMTSLLDPMSEYNFRPSHPYEIPSSTQMKINPKSYLERYMHLVRQYRPLLHLAESSISKILLYATPETLSSSNQHLHLNSEVGYAMLNLFTLVNNVIYYGADVAHFGMTTGMQKDDADKSLGGNQTKIPSVPFILRTILSGLDCIQPVIEQIGILMNKRNTPTPLLKIKHGQYPQQHPWNTIVHLERVKAALRMALLLCYYHELYCQKSNNEGMDHVELGILESGGIILPGEEESNQYRGDPIVLQRKEEEKRRKTLLKGYSGRRTGWNGKHDSAKSKTDDRDSNSSNQSKQQPSSLLEWAQEKCATSGKHMIAPVLLMTGDVLHVLRPLYYSKAQMQYYSSTKINNVHKFAANKRISPLRAWIVALVMDLISQKCILLGLRLHQQNDEDKIYKRYSQTTTTSERTNDEIHRRKMRLLLYLLRSPIWYTVTEPVLLRFIDAIVGVRIGGYVRNVVMCWQQHHFMLD